MGKPLRKAKMTFWHRDKENRLFKFNVSSKSIVLSILSPTPDDGSNLMVATTLMTARHISASYSLDEKSTNATKGLMIWSGWWLSSLSWSKGTRRFSSPSSMSSSRSHFQLTLKLFSSNRSEWGWAGNVSNGYSMESQYVCWPGVVATHSDTERESTVSDMHLVLGYSTLCWDDDSSKYSKYGFLVHTLISLLPLQLTGSYFRHDLSLLPPLPKT